MATTTPSPGTAIASTLSSFPVPPRVPLDAPGQALVEVLIRRVLELQEVLAKHEEALPELGRLHPYHDYLEVYAKLLGVDSKLPRPSTSVGGGGGGGEGVNSSLPEVSLSLPQLAASSAELQRAQAVNAKLRADLAAAGAELTLLSRRLAEVEARLVAEVAEKAHTRQELGTLQRKHNALLSKLKASGLQFTPSKVIPSPRGQGTLVAATAFSSETQQQQEKEKEKENGGVAADGGMLVTSTSMSTTSTTTTAMATATAAGSGLGGAGVGVGVNLAGLWIPFSTAVWLKQLYLSLPKEELHRPKDITIRPGVTLPPPPSALPPYPHAHAHARSHSASIRVQVQDRDRDRDRGLWEQLRQDPTHAPCPGEVLGPLLHAGLAPPSALRANPPSAANASASPARKPYYTTTTTTTTTTVENGGNAAVLPLCGSPSPHRPLPLSGGSLLSDTTAYQHHFPKKTT